MKNLLKKYLKEEINIEELVHKLDTLNYTKEEIKEKGIIYTPKYISDKIVEYLKPKKEETILEPSVGHGIFIFSLLEYIEKKYNLTPEELKEYFIKKVYMKDIKEQTIKELKQIIIIYFIKKKVCIDIEELTNIEIGNTLETTNKTYDIIFGNPPYINIRIMKKETIKYIREKYEFCKKGNIDIYYAFIEYALKNSNKATYITPNSWLYNISAKKIRERIKEYLIKIIDFKDEKIFKNVSTYTSIFLFDKKEKREKLEYQTNIKEKPIEILKKELKDSKWIFYNNYKKCKIKEIKFHTPIATLRDKIYITEEIENKNFIDFYKISKIKTEEEFFKSKKKILFPYKRKEEKYQIMEEEEIEEETLEYLNKKREELLKRDKGKTDKYPKWYAYGRKQGLNFYKEESYLIIMPGMINQEYKFFAIKSNKIKKPFLFSSGFILEIEEKEKTKIIKYLNSKEFKLYLKNNGKVWKGKDRESAYYSLSMTDLKKLLK